MPSIFIIPSPVFGCKIYFLLFCKKDPRTKVHFGISFIDLMEERAAVDFATKGPYLI